MAGLYPLTPLASRLCLVTVAFWRQRRAHVGFSPMSGPGGKHLHYLLLPLPPKVQPPWPAGISCPSTVPVAPFLSYPFGLCRADRSRIFCCTLGHGPVLDNRLDFW